MATTWDEATLTALRVALYADTSALVDLVRDRLTDEILQTVGDALVTAVPITEVVRGRWLSRCNEDWQDTPLHIGRSRACRLRSSM
ncbi:hypothetical protein ACH47B_26435 [Rhodococcus sp. NPDC019627]|uniref:hypothetical protein n=1 Tax=unclassified Rhodococcus (in: high G+C Gram-positive bacteria) TaxID=192944 RepID=UPI0033CD6616